ncbi:MAG: amidohydrolase family protein, partial [Zestosphaera sp.]
SGIARVSDMLRAGVNVTLGTDGGPSNDNYDLIEEMHVAIILQNAYKMDPEALRAEDVLEMATIRGAEALGLSDKVGSIEVGKRADLITIKYWDPKLMPMNDPISHVVFAANGSHVQDVIVDGKIIMKNRNVLTLDEDEVLREVELRSSELFKRTGICVEPNIRYPLT